MAGQLREVFGTILKPDGAPWATAKVEFRLSAGGYDAAGIYPGWSAYPVTDDSGNFSVELWANDQGSEATTYTCRLPNRTESFSFTLPLGNGSPIDLSSLRAAGEIDADWTEALLSQAVLNNPNLRAPVEVSTNAAKLALTGLGIGQIARITGEAGRIEMLVGSDPSTDADWVVLRNTVNVLIDASDSGVDFEVNGVVVAQGVTTNLGWVDPSLPLVFNQSWVLLGVSIDGDAMDPEQTGGSNARSPLWVFPSVPPRAEVVIEVMDP
jgi:hypothetical protein